MNNSVNIGKKKRFLNRIFIYIIGFSLIAASPVSAQDEKVKKHSSLETSSKSTSTLGETVVTAQKREENVQKVPISMNVFSEANLLDAGIVDMTELTYFSPNLYSKQNTNQNMVIIRGISSHNVVLNTPAGLFVDDINYPMTFMQNPDLLDIERIEVLKGPQGTLYGRNTESGAINIVTKKPGNEVKGKLLAETGVYNTPDKTPWFMRLGASVSGPIVENKLYLGISAQTEDTDGYTENVLTNNDKAGKINHKTGQAKIRWTPSKNWDINFLANAFKKKDGYGYLHYINGPSKTDRYQIKWDGANDWVDKNNGQALRINYTHPKFDLVSITSRNEFETDFKNDGEFGTVPLPDQIFKFKNTTYSQELRLASPRDNSSYLEWLVGFYGFTDKNNADAAFFRQERKTDFDNHGYAFFGQTTYTFFDRLHLTCGLRWDHLEADGEQSFNMLPQSYKGDLSHNEILPKGSVAFDVTDDFMVYGTVAKGLLAGGYNYAFATNSQSLTFDPEFTWNYEIGAKSSWLDNKLLVNFSAFYIQIFDKQVEEYLAGFAVRSVTNAAEAYSKGLELELEARPIEGLSITAGLGVSEAKFEDWVSDEMGGGNYNYNGKYLAFVPKYTYNIGVQYLHSNGLFARTDLLGVGDVYTDVKNQVKIPSYELVNLRFGYQGETIEAVLFCKNIFDKEYLRGKSIYWANNTMVEDGMPQTFGITFTYKF